ncbi:major facilitator superfamily domain-containing protein [Usnea florida]
MADNGFVPGTVHLIDIEGILRAKHASGGQKDVVLIPAPSDDPDDPLNWSARRKLMSTASVSLYTFSIGTASAAIYSVLVPIAESTGLTLNDLNVGTGYMILMFGLGCLFWQPLALQYGKRPVYLITMLATTAILIWVPYTNTNGQWIASKLLQGFFGAPLESLCEISLTDIAYYFMHERGTYIALYGFFLIGSNFLANVFAGFINTGQGWKWVLYWCAILTGLSFVLLFFFMEETNYHREMVISDEVEKKANNGPDNHKVEVRDDATEKHCMTEELNASSITEEEIRPAHTASTKSLSKKLRIFDRRILSQPNRLKDMFLRPLIFLSFPVIFYAGFSYGSSLIWFNVLNGTASLILSAQPYNFSSSTVGLAYLSPLIGMTIGSLYTGIVGDWLVLHLARRNGGIMHSEHRLWLFALSALFVPGGLILWGVGAAHGVQWFGLIFAMGVIGFTNMVGLQLSVSYCIDSYRELSGEAVVTVIVIRNVMSFAMGYGITPWVTRMGYQNAFIVAAFAGLAQVLTVLVFIMYGHSMRRASVGRYEHYKEEMMAAGLVH